MSIKRVSKKLIRLFQISNTEILIIVWIWLTAKILIRKLIEVTKIPDNETLMIGWLMFWVVMPAIVTVIILTCFGIL